MNASFEWLRDFVPTELSPREVRDALTTRCATVEEMRPVRQDLGDIVIGRVVEAARHPESDHLWITKVDAGKGELLDVVCGAPNVTAGTAYPFAPVGATLPGGLMVEKRKIRGQLSNGMLCSARELGLGLDHESILALDTDAEAGASFLEIVGAGDTLFVVDVLPNRPDLLSHRGIARELAAASGTPLQEFAGEPWAGVEGGAALPRAESASAATGGVTVSIDDSEGCTRYAAVVIRGVRVAPSPEWLSRRLAAIGARPINNVVDATNYMLHGYGQPMHAFDLAKLGGRVSVRRAKAGEKLVTLDGVERTLRESTTVIAGADRAEAIAGVIGGKGSEVSDATTDILLEVAIFDPKRVRAVRRALGISTDASYRFERHVDPESVPVLAAKGAALIASLTGGRVDDPGVDLHPAPRERERVSVRPARAAAVIGDPIPHGMMGYYLSSVGFNLTENSADLICTTVPSWRSDVTSEVDLIEEIARLHGYERISTDLRPFRLGESPDAPLWLVERTVREALVAEGLLEARPMPFVAEGRGTDIRVRNPLAENEAYLRSSILETLARRAEHNLGHMQGDVRLFEIGTVFARGEGDRPAESRHVAALIMGDRRPRHFTESKPPACDLWDAKWVAEVIALAAFGVGDLKFNMSTDSSRLAVTANGAEIGFVTEVALDSPAWAAPAFGVELDLGNATLPEAGRKPTRALPATPAVQVDLALVVPDDLPAARLAASIRAHAGDLLEHLELFDEFRGHGVEQGQRSLAWRLTFRHPQRTLRDKEIDARRTKLLKALEGELGVRQRTS
ncbi:MAG TPA: phenylalanine--tRNA ligase subunit beta [Candidatus Limnocylindria bacterium]|nr:phenylalanine--tRNA ligase subunit beta [Candidatus Limnocylindria bacterium]